jgi:hypothetical protein
MRAELFRPLLLLVLPGRLSHVPSALVQIFARVLNLEQEVAHCSISGNRRLLAFCVLT